MRLDRALLASAAEGVPNRLVYIPGSGIDTLRRGRYPVRLITDFENLVGEQKVRTLRFRAEQTPRSAS